MTTDLRQSPYGGSPSIQQSLTPLTWRLSCCTSDLCAPGTCLVLWPQSRVLTPISTHTWEFGHSKGDNIIPTVNQFIKIDTAQTGHIFYCLQLQSPYSVWLYVNVTRARVVREEGALIEKVPPFNLGCRQA